MTSRNHFSNLLNQDILTGFVSFKMKLDIGHWTMPNTRKFFLFARRAFPPPGGTFGNTDRKGRHVEITNRKEGSKVGDFFFATFRIILLLTCGGRLLTFLLRSCTDTRLSVLIRDQHVGHRLKFHEILIQRNEGKEPPQLRTLSE